MSASGLPAPLALTMGDPCGIGPETIVKAWGLGALGNTVVVGDPGTMAKAARALGQMLPLAVMDAPGDLAQVPPGALPLWVPPGLPAGLAALPWGQVRAQAGAAAARCIEQATALVLHGACAGLVTAPIHKEALAAAGVMYPGHTEMLQALAQRHTGTTLPVRMMLANEQLRVVLVTVHLSLRRAIEALNTALILETLRITHAAGLRCGVARPRIAVAGLNPHAGEGGLFGSEEIEMVMPAIAAAVTEGIDARGPFAPDTVFMRARDAPGHPGEFDFVVAMTHDHGLIPVKYLGVEQGVNVTLGLPLVRTSPDHGTAFDIAGRGAADPASLIAAMKMARALLPGGGPAA
jgi:4-hydroxythreonine-4-phosphate dehydrogenase